MMTKDQFTRMVCALSVAMLLWVNQWVAALWASCCWLLLWYSNRVERHNTALMTVLRYKDEQLIANKRGDN